MIWYKHENGEWNEELSAHVICDVHLRDELRQLAISTENSIVVSSLDEEEPASAISS